MPLFQFVYPKPEVIGKVEPALFDAIRPHVPTELSKRIGFEVADGVIGEEYLNAGAVHLLQPAREIGELLMAHVKDRKKVGRVRVDFLRGGKTTPEDWHRDSLRQFGGALVVADQHTTLFAHGYRIGLDYLQAERPREKAKEIAHELNIFRPQPFEAVFFERRVLHSRPSEDLSNRTFILAMAS